MSSVKNTPRTPSEEVIVLSYLDDPEVEQPLSLSEVLTHDRTVGKLKSDTWITIPIITASVAMHHTYVGKPIRIVGTIASLSSSHPIKLPGGLGTIITPVIRDLNGTEIKCFPVPFDEYGRDLQHAFAHSLPGVLCGTVYPKYPPSGKSMFMFSLKRVDLDVRPLDLLPPGHCDMVEIEKIVKRESKKAGIADYIKKQLVENLGIHGLKDAPDLNKAIDFMILQAVADGMDGINSMKLHSLVIGPPNVGKKLLNEIAKALNARCWEVTCTSSKLTQAGLVGDVRIKDDQKVSSPGFLPLASSGILSIQDFHELVGGRREIFATLSKVMEDGSVIDSTSARTVHRANTAIHIDTNLMSQVYGESKASFSDLSIPGNIVSRFDFIIEIERDTERQGSISSRILDGSKTIGKSGVPSDDTWKHNLQGIIAYLRDANPIITIPEPIRKTLDKDLRALLANPAYHKLVESTLLHDNMIRLTMSFRKFIRAIAGVQMKASADKECVDLALSFLKVKLDFLSRHQERLGNDGKVPTRIDFILREFAGKEVRLADVTKRINELTSAAATERTLRRDLESVGAKRIRVGVWKVPE